MRHFRRHADALAQRRMRVDGLADVHCVRTHLDSQRDLSDHVARVGADHATAQDLAVAPASMAAVPNRKRRVRLRCVILYPPLVRYFTV